MAKDNEGKTPMEIAMENEKIADYLMGCIDYNGIHLTLRD